MCTEVHHAHCQRQKLSLHMTSEWRQEVILFCCQGLDWMDDATPRPFGLRCTHVPTQGGQLRHASCWTRQAVIKAAAVRGACQTAAVVVRAAAPQACQPAALAWAVCFPGACFLISGPLTPCHANTFTSRPFQVGGTSGRLRCEQDPSCLYETSAAAE